MNYTATALIFTFHHLSVVTAFLIAIILGTMVFGLFLKTRKNRAIALFFTFLASLILGLTVAEKVYDRKPISLEIVRAG